MANFTNRAMQAMEMKAMERAALLDQLLTKYRALKRPGDLLSRVYESREKSFTLLAAVKRQVEWNIQHGEHTSPYHQALTSLFVGCSGFENIGLFELYINEFIPGIEAYETEPQKLKALEATLFAQNAWDQCKFLPSSFNVLSSGCPNIEYL